MKKTLLLFTVIIGCISAYVLLEIALFQQDEPMRFVFNAPVLPEGISIGGENLTPEQHAAQARASEIIQKTVNTYSAARDTIPQQAAESIDILTNQTAEGHVPPLFLSVSDPATGKRRLEPLIFQAAEAVVIGSGKKSVVCETQVPASRVLIGNDEDNTLECSLPDTTYAGDRLFLGGPGNDKISDIQGNRVVNGGTGNDTIALGKGRSLIILDAGWGNDQITTDCDDIRITAQDVPLGSGVAYPHPTANLIILSPRLQAKDLRWDGNVLKSSVSADTLTVSDNCFTVVPTLP